MVKNSARLAIGISCLAGLLLAGCGSDPPARAGVLTGHSGKVRQLAFSSDGRILASGDELGGLKLWDVAGQSEIASEAGGGPGAPIEGLAFTPDGKSLAVIRWRPHDDPRHAGHFIEDLELWQTNPLQKLRTVDGAGSALCFTADGKRLFGGDIEALQERTVPELDIVREWPTGRVIQAIAVAPDRSWAAAGTIADDDSAAGITLTVVDLAGKAPVRHWSGDKSIQSLKASADGRWLWSGGGGTIRQWDTSTWTVRDERGVGLEEGAIAIAPGSEWYVAAGAEAGWFRQKRELAFGRLGEAPRFRTDHVHELFPIALSPDGRTMAGGRDTAIELWNHP